MAVIKPPWRATRHIRLLCVIGFFLLPGFPGMAAGGVAPPSFPAQCALVADRLVVPVFINGTGPHGFVLDLALKRPVLHGATAEALHLVPEKLDPLPGETDTPEREVSSVITKATLFQAGSLPAQPETFGVMDLTPLSVQLGTHVAGLLPAHQPGYEVTVSFDPPRVIWRPLEYASLLEPAEHTTEMNLGEDGSPLVEVRVNGQYDRTCRLDLGLGATAAFTEETLAAINAVTPATPSLKVLLPGGGAVEQTRLGAVAVAGVVITRPRCEVSAPERGDRLGTGFFRSFPVTLNYEHGLVRFDAGKSEGREESALVGSGVLPFQYVSGYWQLAVAEESPAFRAGVRPGDLLLGANGLNLYQVTHNDLAKLLTSQAGMRMRLLVGRGGRPQPIEMVSAELL